MRLRHAAVIAASILAGTGAHASAFSTTVPNVTATGNASDPLEKTYQVTGNTSCTTSTCVLAFPATTHSKTLISHVSCFFEIPSTDNIFGFELGSETGNQANFLVVAKYGSASGVTSYAVNAQTYLFFASGEQPKVSILSTGNSVPGLSCTLSGNYY